MLAHLMLSILILVALSFPAAAADISTTACAGASTGAAESGHTITGLTYRRVDFTTGALTVTDGKADYVTLHTRRNITAERMVMALRGTLWLFSPAPDANGNRRRPHILGVDDKNRCVVVAQDNQIAIRPPARSASVRFKGKSEKPPPLDTSACNLAGAGLLGNHAIFYEMTLTGNNAARRQVQVSDGKLFHLFAFATDDDFQQAVASAFRGSWLFVLPPKLGGKTDSNTGGKAEPAPEVKTYPIVWLGLGQGGTSCRTLLDSTLAENKIHPSALQQFNK